MTNTEKVYGFIRSRAPARVTNADLKRGAGVKPHQQVYQITQRLIREGRISGMQHGGEWVFWVAEPDGASCADSRTPSARAEATAPAPWHTASQRGAAAIRPSTASLSPAQFERVAVEAMTRHFGKALQAGSLPGVPKRFDLVSDDGTVVGDAKYFTMVGGERIPPAKFSVIAEYVWMLEKIEAEHRFLVFGHDRRVPEEWLRRYGGLVAGVEFYFLRDDGTVDRIDAVTAGTGGRS